MSAVQKRASRRRAEQRAGYARQLLDVQARMLFHDEAAATELLDRCAEVARARGDAEAAERLAAIATALGDSREEAQRQSHALREAWA